MRIGSLFSGAGGLDLAIEAVFGATVAWHCENDPAVAKVLAHRWPDIPNIGDITAVDWAAVEPVDILCGGYPCQPFSAAGRRKGTTDDRHLWPYFAEAIRRIRPGIVVLENVSGHRSMGFDQVLADLAAIGYDAQWCSVRASDVGAPHRRERLFVITHPNNAAADQEWPRAQSGQGSADAAHSPGDGRHEGWPEPARIERGSDAAVGGAGPVELLPTPSKADGDGGHLNRSGARADELLLPGIAHAYGNGELLPTPAASRSGRNQSPSPGAAIRPSLDSINDLLPTPTGRDGKGANQCGDETCLAGALLPTPAASDGTGGGCHPGTRVGHTSQIIDVALLHGSPHWGKYEPAIRRWESLTRPAPSPTEPNTKGNPRLAAAFSEWMMGWPDGWVTAVPGISRNDALRIIGNGVVPQQAIAALRWLLSVAECAA